MEGSQRGVSKILQVKDVFFILIVIISQIYSDVKIYQMVHFTYMRFIMF